MFYRYRHHFGLPTKRLCLLLFGMAVLLQACGGDETSAPKKAEDVPNSLAMQPKVETPYAPPAGVEMGAVVPETLSVLKFMPPSTQVALALPALPALREKIRPLIRVALTEAEWNEASEEAVAELGQDLGVDAATIEELAAALGIDEGAPMAVFVDYSVLFAASNENRTKMDEEADNEESEASSFDIDAADDPNFLLVLPMVAPDKVQTAIDYFVAEDQDLRDLTEETEVVDGVALTIRGGYACFFTNQHVILGHKKLVRDAVARITNPATFRYGTTEFPATTADEIPILFYGNRVVSILDEAAPELTKNMSTSERPVMEKQLDVYRKLFADGENEDPVVGTLSMQDDAVSLWWRADGSANPGLRDYWGEASPLRLARYVPENTLGLLSFRFNDVFKGQLSNGILPIIQATGSANVSWADQIIAQVGDELSLAVTDGVDGTAGLYIMLGLANGEGTRNLLKLFLPLSEGTDYKGYTITRIPDTPLPVYLSFIENFAVAGTDEGGIRTIIDHHLDGSASSLFENMVPPLDIDKPRYQFGHVNTEILATASASLLGAFGKEVDPADMMPLEVWSAIREIRMSSDVDGDWLNGRLNLYLNDLDARAKNDGVSIHEDDVPVASEEVAPVAEP